MEKHLPLRYLFRVHSDNTDLVHAQMGAMNRQLPLLYLVVSVNVIALAASFFSDAPSHLTLWVPGVLVTIALLRSFMWWKRGVDTSDTKASAEKLVTLVWLAQAIAIVLSVWCFLLFPYGNAFQQSHIAFFLSVTLIGTIFATVQLPPAALGCLLISGSSFVLFFATRGNPVFLSMALNFVMVLIVVFMLVRSYHRNFTGYLRSNRELSEANEELSALYEELKYHRDNLANEVSKRTQELEAQTLQLETALQAERKLNEMQNEFVSMVSHEFRTPLAIIDGTARRVQRRYDEMSKPEVEDRMDKIRGSVNRLAGLVERTLDASKLASGRIRVAPESYNPRALLSELVERHRELSSAHQITLAVNDLPERALGDARLMDHVFANLISNAIKYSMSNPYVNVSGRITGDDMIIVVRDQGVGIPESELNHVAERFFRASTSAGIQGTGIGLNLVSDLVAMHHGQMNIQSKEGEWTEVTLRIPVRPVFTDNDADKAEEPGQTEETSQSKAG
jgi:signal transduction histidine kinase